MKTIIKSSLLGLGILCAIPAIAQDNDETHEGQSLIVVNTKKSNQKIVKQFKQSMNEGFNEPGAPRFLLYDQKHDVAFGIGGFLRVRTAYDWGSVPTNSFGFIPFSIPVPANKANNGQFTIDPYKSNIFFKLLGNTKGLGAYEAYISGQFTGPGNSFAINDAYLRFMGFTVGKTWSLFNDLGAVPPTIDFQGPNGAGEMRTGQIAYAHEFKNGIKLGVSVEQNQSSGTYDSKVGAASQRIPDIPAYIKYSWCKGASHVKLAGVLRNMSYQNLVTTDNKTATGYGVQLSGTVKVGKPVQLYFQTTYGKGIAQYINDLSGNGLDFVYDADESGKMVAQEAFAWYGGLQFNLSPSVFASATYSQARIFPKDGYKPANQYRYGQYIVGNVFWNLSSAFQFGAEYLWGNRVNIDGSNEHANCIQALVQYNF